MVLNRWGDFVRPRFPELVLTACIPGFAFLIAELVSYHHYREGTQIIGFSAAILGLVLSLLAFARQCAVRLAVLVLLALLAVMGLYGALEQREARAEDAARFAQRQTAQVASSGVGATGGSTRTAGTSTSSTSERGAASGPPPGFRPGSQIPVLAPLSLSGLAGLTLLAMLARRPDEVAARSGNTTSDFHRSEGA